MNRDWTEEELTATVVAYLEMRDKELNGTHFVKKHYYADLADQFNRTQKSFEYRMQNISYICALLGRPWVTGLKPAKNVGSHNAPIIERLLCELSGQANRRQATFELEVIHSKTKPLRTMPGGTQEPKQRYDTIAHHGRDPRVKAWILRMADGQCESCGQQAPFISAIGEPFLEVHHLRTLAEGGSDTVSNTVALCPNCHRAFHYGLQQVALKEALYHKFPRLVRE
ncbi:HNH endonuclease [Aeromonas rivuli]|uniref:HNH endonuclease n=1 Tax=Aeromonas rivuli TaxID=648794 RepID=UPI001CCD3C73|nr:HNH endonuclease signature motif containing protein [Aeromonas rivuli]